MEKSQNVGTKSAFTYGLNWLLLKYNDQIDNDCKMILFPQKKKSNATSTNYFTIF